METVGLSASRPWSLPWVQKVLTRSLTETIELTGIPGLVVHGESGRVYLHHEHDGVQLVQTGLHLDYWDIDLTRKIIVALADDPDVMVDDDFGHVLQGDQFVALLKRHPTWDWRKTLAVPR